jgi:hypothetical protein
MGKFKLLKQQVELIVWKLGLQWIKIQTREQRSFIIN